MFLFWFNWKIYFIILLFFHFNYEKFSMFFRTKKCGTLRGSAVGVKSLRSRCKFLFCSVFIAQDKKNATSEVKGECFGALLWRHGDFIHLVVTPREFTWYILHLGRSNLCFACSKHLVRLHKATQKASPEVEICVPPILDHKSGF